MAWGIIWLFQPLLERAGVPLAWYGGVQAAACVGQILLLSRVELIEEVLGSKRRVLTWTAYGSGAVFAGLAGAGSAWAVVPGIVAAFTLGLPRTALFSAYMNKHIPSDKRATVLSFASMVRTLAIVVVNPLIGLVGGPLPYGCPGRHGNGHDTGDGFFPGWKRSTCWTSVASLASTPAFAVQPGVEIPVLEPGDSACAAAS